MIKKAIKEILEKKLVEWNYKNYQQGIFRKAFSSGNIYATVTYAPHYLVFSTYRSGTHNNVVVRYGDPDFIERIEGLV